MLFIALIASASWADRVPVLSEFPTLGRCNGNGVRLRADTDTKSTILGKLDDGDIVVVLDETLAHGDTWYEVDHPTKNGKAWVFGKYLEAVYEESYQANPKHQLIMNVYLTFGMTPEKAIALSGKPKDLARVLDDWIEHPARRAAYEQKYLESSHVYDQAYCMDRMEEMLREVSHA